LLEYRIPLNGIPNMKKVIFMLLMSLPLIAVADMVEIDIHGMSCSFCVEGLQKELSQLPGIERVEVSLKNKKVLIVSGGEELDLERVNQAIIDSGFTPMETRHIDTP